MPMSADWLLFLLQNSKRTARALEYGACFQPASVRPQQGPPSEEQTQRKKMKAVGNQLMKAADQMRVSDKFSELYGRACAVLDEVKALAMPPVPVLTSASGANLPHNSVVQKQQQFRCVKRKRVTQNPVSLEENEEIVNDLLTDNA